MITMGHRFGDEESQDIDIELDTSPLEMTFGIDPVEDGELDEMDDAEAEKDAQKEV